MCGIYGVVIHSEAARKKDIERNIRHLSKLSVRRGSDSFGFFCKSKNKLKIGRSDNRRIANWLTYLDEPKRENFFFGFSRMKTDGETEDQPIFYDGIALIHNGIVVNHKEVRRSFSFEQQSQLDSNVLAYLIERYKSEGFPIDSIPHEVMNQTRGAIALIAFLQNEGKILCFSNNGSLYQGQKDGATYIASESFWLQKIACNNILQIKEAVIFNVAPISGLAIIDQTLSPKPSKKLLFDLTPNISQEKLLEIPDFSKLKRCSLCILPMTFPYIEFERDGVCNYCRNYPQHFASQKISDKNLFRELSSHKASNLENKVLIPLSGGRDSTFSLIRCHEWGLKVVAYTYDWGFVTDIARDNISSIVGELGIEHILVSADIRKKRDNVRKNLIAWLEAPHLGLMSLLTSGDKQFFKYSKILMNELMADFQVWGTNPLETTHFKLGFLGIPPTFLDKNVYQQGLQSQVLYQSKRFRAMSKNLHYFNGSLFDTLSGELHRSILPKKGYVHFFDFYDWNENEILSVIRSKGWKSLDNHNITWRIGDATAPFYNYVYNTVAGFTESDTFRSNQIREGKISRDEALKIINEENRPRFEEIKWYLDIVGIEYETAIKRINSLARLYEI
jgi:glutamine---fructose-6-phosphate transaminase (isomerizing)